MIFFTEKLAAQHLGCYKDNALGTRLMLGYRKDFPDSLTPEKCVIFCNSIGFAYAGVRQGYVN